MSLTLFFFTDYIGLLPSPNTFARRRAGLDG
jgi:hypothetical protein